ncbi:MAG: hypothetical protein N5P05_003403 [Chroococcopsis gigantea SAG 12.99]|jgi:hypothetical protein|nr:DUF29 domain-containing protein [Chlorogloea purpurea SAG 13.99]MDV3001797.1 hypothetical protein [Chroococcopsis gigantea SAG 12.99]
MTAKINLPTQYLYERDYSLWLSTTLEQLRDGKFDELDLNNLMEEIEDMGRSVKHALESYLARLFEHLLKITYWESERERCQRGWRKEIRNFRFQILKLLKESPSLKPYLKEIFEEYYLFARLSFIDETGIDDIPLHPMGSPEQVLDFEWFPLELE